MNCRKCDQPLTLSVDTAQLIIDDKNVSIPIEYMLCTHCGRESIPKNLILKNDASFRKVKH